MEEIVKYLKIAVFCLITCATLSATAQVNVSFRGVVQQAQDGSFVITGRAGTDVMSAIIYIVPVRECAGRTLMLSAEFRTQSIASGTKAYHGVHFDYEMRAGRETTWPSNWEESPSDDWQVVTRMWSFPPDLERAEVRIGLQNVSGNMLVRNLRIGPCS